MGSIVRVLDSLTDYMYIGTDPQSGQKIWYEARQIPDHSVTDPVQRLEYDRTLPIGDRLNWVDDRPTAEVVADLAELHAMPIERLVEGKLVYVQSEGLLYEYIATPTTHSGTSADWTPLVSGMTIVGRQGDLPDPATETIVHGQMFLIRDDFSGEDLERFVVWDETIPARGGVAPTNIGHNEVRGTPTVGTPTICEIHFDGMPFPQVANATAQVIMRITTATTPTHRFVYDVQPGDTLHDIAAGLAAVYDNSGAHDPDTVATAVGDVLYITGSPGRAAQSARTVTGARFFGVATSDADLVQFLGAATALNGSYVVNTSGGDLTAPDGTVVPDETALIIESLNPLGYHVADAPTPVVPATTLTQQGLNGVVARDNAALLNWISTDPPVGSYILNMTPNTLIAAGVVLQPNRAAVAVRLSS